MSGTITVTWTTDWLTPYEVEVRSHQGAQRATARFAAPGKAQAYALAKADETGFALAYRDDRPANALEGSTNGAPAKGFADRFQRICSKCREARPLRAFGSVTHRNRTTGREVFHGYTEKCLDCGGAA